MKKFKKAFAVLGIASISLCSFNPIFAHDNSTVLTSESGTSVNVTFEGDTANQITSEELQSIVNENSDAENITIYEVGVAEVPPVDEYGISTYHWLIDKVYSPVKTYTSKNVFSRDDFMDSCAKGETKTITRTISATLEAEYSGELAGGDLGLKGSLTYSLERGKTLVGPPEDSRYNTREFRVKFYVNKGTWTQNVLLNDGRTVTRSGSFIEPNRYVSYSKDTKA